MNKGKTSMFYFDNLLFIVVIEGGALSHIMKTEFTMNNTTSS